MSTLALMRPSWWSANATVGGAVDTDYLAAWLCDTRPGRPVRSADNNLSLTVSNPEGPVDVVVVGHHNLQAGTPVVIGGDLELALTAPTVPADGIPLNFFELVGSPASAASFTVGITGHVVPPVIGEVAAGALETIGLPLLGSTKFGYRFKNIRPQVDIGSVLPYDKGIASRVLSGTYILTTAEKDLVVEWFLSQRSNSRPSVIFPDLNVQDAWFVEFTSLDNVRPLVSHQDGPTLWSVDLEFVELDRSRW